VSTRKQVHFSVLWLVLGLGVFTHSAFLVMNHSYYALDTPSYLVPADNLLQKHEFVNELNHPELSRTPGYPLLLALFRIRPLKLEYLILLQHILCVLTAMGLAAAALKTTNSSLIALASASILSLDLATLVVANSLLTETIFMVVIALVTWLLYQVAKEPTGAVGRYAAAGVMGGYAVLVRPVALLYFVPVSIYLWLVLKRRSLRPILIFAAFFLLLPLIWSARNYVESGYFGISTIGAHNLLAYRAAGVLAVRQSGDYLTNVSNARSALIKQACGELKREYGRDCTQVTEAQQAQYSARVGRDIILRDVPGYFKSALIGLVYIVLGGGAEAVSKIARINPHLAERIVLLVTLPEACLAIIGSWFWFGRERNLCYLLVLTVGYFFLISAGGEAYSRFRVPVMPMYALLVAGGISAILQWGRRIWDTAAPRASTRNSSAEIGQANTEVLNINTWTGSCS
jgi:Dolichyl-phosphate-mannose-protein mannosyltransferase